MTTAATQRRAERFVIRGKTGYLSITAGHERINTVADVQQAWVFHTLEKALSTARELTALMGYRHDVMQVH